MDELIVNVALTGCVHHKTDNPALPVTPEEVAADVRRCMDAGASVFHIHARDERGNPTWSAGRYIQYVNAVRETGAVVVASCSGRHFHSLAHRSSCLIARPDMASLTLGSVDFPDGTTSENGRRTVNALLDRMREYGVKPECEAFDVGHLHRLQQLAEDGEFERPIYANVILGVHLPATRRVFQEVMEWTRFPAELAMTAVGRDAWRVQAWAIALGYHVRVGLEDSLYYEKGIMATNVRLVERVVERARGLGREPATVEETREALGLGRVGA